MPSVLDVENLSVRFGQNVVLRGLSFAVEPGETLAILGPNGSGKTVLFKALIGALPFEGRVAWAPGVKIAYVPQKLDLERDLPLSGGDFLRSKSAIAGCPPGDIPRVLEAVGLAPESSSLPIGSFSGGQFQRLLLAFALLGNPNVLLFDEPTAGVDEPGQERLYEMIHRLKEKERLTLLLISHELTLVYRYASRVLCLAQGLACLGPPREVLTPERLEELYGGSMKHHVHDGTRP
jgi:zinc transport system ATP-binding protein